MSGDLRAWEVEETSLEKKKFCLTVAIASTKLDVWRRKLQINGPTWCFR